MNKMLVEWMRWVLALFVYEGFVTECFPGKRPGEVVRFEVRTGGIPTVRSTLMGFSDDAET